MRKPDKLFLLIKSLSGSEKRYFRLNAGLHKGNKKFMRLFDAIHAMESWDPEALSAQFRGESFSAHLAVTQNDLYDQLLRVLRQYHAGLSIDARIGNRLHNAEILFHKGLYAQSEKEISKVAQLASRHSRFSWLSLILDMQRKVSFQTNPAALEEDNIKRVSQQKQDALRREENLNTYWQLYHLAYLHYRKANLAKDREALKRLAKIAEDPLLNNTTELLSDKASYYFYSLKGMYFQLIRDTRGSRQAFMKVVESVYANPDGIRDDPRILIVPLFNYIIACIDDRRFDEGSNRLLEFRKIPKQYFSRKSPHLEAIIFKYALELQGNLFNKSGEFDKTLALQPEFKQGIQTYGEFLDPLSLLKLHFNMAYAEFGQAEFARSFGWIAGLLRDSDVDWRKETHHVYLLQMVLLTEMEEFSLLQSLLGSVHRSLVKRELADPFISALFSFFKKVPDLSNTRKKHAKMKLLRDNLSELAREPLAALALNDFDLIAWLDSHLEGKSFREIIQQKAGSPVRN
jgi:hypothetical protein